MAKTKTKTKEITFRDEIANEVRRLAGLVSPESNLGYLNLRELLTIREVLFSQKTELRHLRKESQDGATAHTG